MNTNITNHKRHQIARSTKTAAAAACVLGTLTSAIGQVQLNDFRLPQNANGWNGSTWTAVDPGWNNLQTRSVAGAPVSIPVYKSGTSQYPGGASPDSADSQVSPGGNYDSFRPNTAVPSASNPYAGIEQWSFDLTPLDSYLSGNSLAASALDLKLTFNCSQTSDQETWDAYLSYTDAGLGIAKTDISLDDAGYNYSTFLEPGSAANAGDIVNGQFQVLALRQTGLMTLDTSLLSLYNSGVRQFNLVISSETKFINRNLAMGPGEANGYPDGLYLITATVPEPSTFALGILGVMGMLASWLKRRRN